MDHRLAEFAARLPSDIKIRGRSLRIVQRRLAARYLPPEILSRPKQGFSSALPYIRAGTLQPLAVAALKRSPQLPDVPLVADAGFPGFDVTSWYGIAVRSGTPTEIVDRLYRETADVLKLDDVKERFDGMGVEPGGLPPSEFATMVRSEAKKWGDIIVRANIKLE